MGIVVFLNSLNSYISLLVREVTIIMSCCQHGHRRPSLVTPLYRSSLLAGPQGYIQYPHRAVVCKFEMVTLLVHRRTSLMSSSLLLQQCPACLVRLTLIVFVMGGRWPYSWCFWGVAARTCPKLLAVFLCSCRQAFSLSASLASM